MSMTAAQASAGTCGVCGKHVAASLLRLHEMKCAKQRAARKLLPAEETVAPPMQPAAPPAAPTTSTCDTCGGSFSERLIAIHRKKCARQAAAAAAASKRQIPTSPSAAASSPPTRPANARAAPVLSPSARARIASPPPQPSLGVHGPAGYAGRTISPPLSPSLGKSARPRIRIGSRVTKSTTSLPSSASSSVRDGTSTLPAGRRGNIGRVGPALRSAQKKRVASAAPKRDHSNTSVGSRSGSSTPSVSSATSRRTAYRSHASAIDRTRGAPPRYTTGSPVPYARGARPGSGRRRQAKGPPRVIWEPEPQQPAPGRPGREGDVTDIGGTYDAMCANQKRLEVMLDKLQKPLTPNALTRRERAETAKRAEQEARSHPIEKQYSKGAPVVYRPVRPIATSRIPLLNLYKAVPSRKAPQPTREPPASSGIPVHVFRRRTGA
eukprot:TRINITY_DN7403_c0_g1_i1.p1 TRINITY_DN7403_c0_g1~~TRINITY_DN7403_c0_g1_i1.p1  ORF type:complete len:437 (+),score=55.27 TRINITY_DN7403_c0_g1_i1:112-1422(+)